MEDIAMKKTYINPQISVVIVPAAILLAGSNPQLSNTNFDSSTETVLGHDNDFDW